MAREPSISKGTARRREVVASAVRNFYARAAYVTPRVALDAATARALRRVMRARKLGVSDAIRAAIVEAAAATKNHRGSQS